MNITHILEVCLFCACVCLLHVCLCEGPSVFVYSVHMMLCVHLCVCLSVCVCALLQRNVKVKMWREILVEL